MFLPVPPGIREISRINRGARFIDDRSVLLNYSHCKWRGGYSDYKI